MQTTLIDIGEAAEISGMAPSTLRFYEDEGFIEASARKGLRRQYRPEVLDTLAVIAMCRSAGFSLAEIKELIATRGDRSWKRLAKSKRDELRAKARELDAMADRIDHAVGCPSPSLFDCEHFRAALREALPVGH